MKDILKDYIFFNENGCQHNFILLFFVIYLSITILYKQTSSTI